MAKKTKSKTRKARPIVTGYLEKVNARIFDKYQKEITDMIKGHQGLYALYRKNKLYYVGLASNLRNRIKYHLRDRHQGKWTHFSLYIIRKSDHIKELESLLLRIAYPEGNSQRGKLRTTNNLLPKLKTQVKQKIKEEYEDLFKGHRAVKVKAKKKTASNSKVSKKEKPLKGVFPKGKRLCATYKGKEYKAWVFRSGTVKLRSNGQLYDSPSAAGKAVTKRSTNGWAFWKYRDEFGKFMPLSKLKQKR
jgi:hypothetical protein